MGKKTYLIGRHGNVKLNDETVSRRHACLEVEGDTMVLRDLNSRNGTYEVRDAELVRFTAGPVERHQVFAFGECVRTVAQLVRTAELEAAMARAKPAADIDIADDRFEATSVGSLVVPRRRLSSADIVQMLERAEDELSSGRDVVSVCTELGITAQRYQRWCEEYGGTRREREQCVATLRRENARLKERVRELEVQLQRGTEPQDDVAALRARFADEASAG